MLLLPFLWVYYLRYILAGSPSDAVQIESITVSPDPPKPGEDMTVTVKGTALETIEVRSSVVVCVLLLNLL